MQLHRIRDALSSAPPIRRLAAALVVGALGGHLCPAWTLMVAAVAVVTALRHGRSRPFLQRPRLVAALLPLALLIGALRAATDVAAPAPPDYRETPVILSGTVVDAPRVQRDASGGRQSVLRMRLQDDRRLASLRIRLARGEAPPELSPGDRIRVAGRCSAPRSPSNPGEADRRAALRREGVVLRISAPTSTAVRIDPARAPALLAALRRAGGDLRRRMLDNLAAACGGRTRSFAVLAALLVGDRTYLRDDVTADFRRAGASHLLAVSGLHVVLLVGGVAALLDRLVRRLGPRRMSRWLVLGASLAFLLIYAAVCQLATPVVRASVFVAVAIVARHMGRRTGTPDHLAVAAALVVAAAPAEVLRPGFHLSFSAVIGLCVLTPRFREALFASWDILARFPEALPPWQLRAQAWLAAGISASLAASTATAPVTAAVFGELHPAAPVANLLAVPIVAVLLPAAAIAALVGGIAAPVTAPVLDLGVSALREFLGLLAAVPGATWSAGVPPPWAVIAAALTLVAAALVRPWRPRHLLAPIACWTLLGLAAGPLSLGRDLEPAPGEPSTVVLDVGHGVAVLLRGGDGGAVLYDAGGRLPGTAERIVVPALHALGVTRLAAVAISHEDSDHCGAVPDLIERIPVGAVIVPDGYGSAPAGRRVLRACARRAVPVIVMGRGDRWETRDIRLLGLHPARGTPGPAENASSLVLHARLGGDAARRLTLLLPGDIEDAELDALAADATVPPAEVLLLPHHGRGSPIPQERLAQRCGADVLVASTRATAPSAVPRAWITGREGALLLRPGRAPIRLVRSNEVDAEGSGP